MADSAVYTNEPHVKENWPQKNEIIHAISKMHKCGKIHLGHWRIAPGAVELCKVEPASKIRDVFVGYVRPVSVPHTVKSIVRIF